MQESIGVIRHWFSKVAQPPGGFLEICADDLDCHKLGDATGI